MAPAPKPPSSTPANHDSRDAPRRHTPPTQPQPHAPTTAPVNTPLSWAEIATRAHPNPQHIAFSTGRGPTSSKRYRRRTTRRQLLTTNLASSSSSTLISHTGNHTTQDTLHERTTSILQKIRAKHRNVLLPNATYDPHPTDTDIDHRIELEIAEINTISTTFDTIAARIDLAWEQDATTPHSDSLTSHLDHAYILPVEAALLRALDEFTQTTDALLDQHQAALENINASSADHYTKPHAIDDDDYSIFTDDEANTDELTLLYAPNPPIADNEPPHHQPDLMTLLLRYHTPQPLPQPPHIAILPPFRYLCTPPPRSAQRTAYTTILPPLSPLPHTATHTPLATRKITTINLNDLPILPPIPPLLHTATHTSPTTQRTTANSLNDLPILPPVLPAPYRPDDNTPSHWTHHEEPHHDTYQHDEHFDTTNQDDEYIDYIHDACTHLQEQHSRPHANARRPHARTYNQRRPAPPNTRRPDSTISHRRRDRTFTNKLVFVTQNVRGLPTEDDTKLQSLINQMKEHQWSAMCLQETWRLGDDEFYIDGYKIILKGHSTKENERGHVMGGVAIILSPEMDLAHQLASSKKVTLPNEHKYEGRFVGAHLHFKKRDSHGKRIKGITKLTLCSIYHPVDSREHDEFNGITQTILNRLSTDTQLIFGQDINCNVGTAPTTDDPFRPAVGPNGINNRNNKGIKFLQHLCALNMKVANSFFVKSNYATWKNFKPSHPSHHMLDVFSTSNTFFKHVLDCETIPHGTDCTDHSATAITININCIAIQSKKNNKARGGRADWHRISQDQDTRHSFNENLSRELQHTDTTDDYTSFFEIVKTSAESTATITDQPPVAWFAMSKDKLLPIIGRATALQQALRDPTNANPAATRRELQLTYRLRNIAVREAKSTYMSHIAQKIGTLSGENTRAMWEAVNECKLGHENSYIRPKTMSLTNEDGSKTINDKENIAIMRTHCEKLFNNKKQVSANALDLIDQRELEHDLDAPITWKEFTKAINGLKNNKSPGANEIPAEAFKAMNNDNRNHVFSFINSFWNNNTDYPEWHSGLGVPVQKTPHPSNPNQYRIVNLMDVGSKIFSRILTVRLYKLLALHGTKYQFGATPHAGCQDANYTLKSLLHLRRQHNLETFVVFADLVKAFDTSDHTLIVAILLKYGAPQKLCNAIERLYTQLHVTLKIGKETTDIDQTVGVRQGDNLSPVIFLFIMTAFSEILDKKWTAAGITRVEAEHTPLPTLRDGQLTGHTNPQRKRGSTTHITQTLFLDDSGFPFNTREDAITGTQLVKETFASLGLEMHCGTKDTDKSKTEILWVPSPTFYTNAAAQMHQHQLAPNLEPHPTTVLDLTDPSSDTSDDFDDQTPQATLSTRPRGRTRPLTFSTMTRQQREALYWQSPTTDRITLDDNGAFIDFTAHFKYLGSFISFDLTDDMDIRNRITKANQAMGALRHFWRNPYADLQAKKTIFLAIPANLLLWGCETWALRQSHIDKLNVFWHRAIRNVLGIRMSEVIDDHISNEQIRKIFHDIPDAEAMLNARSMNYLGKTARSPDSHPPKLLLTAWVQNPRPKSGVLSTNKKAMVRSLNALLPIDTLETTTRKCRVTGETIATQRHNPNGDLKNWLHIALDKPIWDWHIYRLTHPNGPIPNRPDPSRPNHQPPEENDDNDHPEAPNDTNNRRNNHRHRSSRRHRTNTHSHSQPTEGQGQQHPSSTTNGAHPYDPTQNHTRTNYNIANVGHTRADSIKALELDHTATESDIKHRFRTLSLIYHPDKYNEALGISAQAATAHFQMLNNAYAHLRHAA